MSFENKNIPKLIPMNAYNANQKQSANTQHRQRVPPPLEIKQNKENISFFSNSNNNTKNKKKKPLYHAVPPLELLVEEKEKSNNDKIDDNKTLKFENENNDNKDENNNTQQMDVDLAVDYQHNETEQEPIPIDEGVPIAAAVQQERVEQKPQIQTAFMDVDEAVIDNKKEKKHVVDNEYIQVSNGGFTKIKIVSSTGRLLECKEEWNKRPKIIYNEELNTMSFRPLRMKCTHCDEAYTKTHDLYAHIRTHQHHTKCPHCGKILTCMATFVYHVRTHTAEKPYYCPCNGCDFKNAVKYNLKVHLASIRHGGKNNLKKYAKVLDLDVCEKSLRKRKDNSVHELGSRRSKKKRRKLQQQQSSSNNNINHHHLQQNMMNTQQHHHHLQPIQHHQYLPSYTQHLKQEEYDQFAASLLFSLSAIPPFDPQAMNLIDWTSIIGGNNNQSISNENNINHDKQHNVIKKEEKYSVSSSTSTIWETTDVEQQKQEQQQTTDSNSPSTTLLIPKQEQFDYTPYITNPLGYDTNNPYYYLFNNNQLNHNHNYIKNENTEDANHANPKINDNDINNMNVNVQCLPINNDLNNNKSYFLHQNQYNQNNSIN